MGLFDKFKKKDSLNSSENVLQNDTAQHPETSIIWLPNILNQFADMANKDTIYGEKIPNLIKAYKSLFNAQASRDEIQRAFSALMNEVVRTVYIVPFHYDAANEFENDRVIHCTAKAANKINIESIVYRCQNMTMEQMSKLAWIKDNATNKLTVDISWWDISRIAGSDGFRFEASGSSNTMYPYIGNNSNGSFFLCFTGIDQCLKIYGQDKNLHIALFTINDIVEYMFSGNMQGVIINPDTESHCFIAKDAFQIKKD